jgi:hypothetical protein
LIFAVRNRSVNKCNDRFWNLMRREILSEVNLVIAVRYISLKAKGPGAGDLARGSCLWCRFS